MDRRYTVSQDKTGMWYAHMKGYPYIPVSGSFYEKKSDAMQYARMYDGLTHRVQQIEDRRHEAWKKEMEVA